MPRFVAIGIPTGINSNQSQRRPITTNIQALNLSTSKTPIVAPLQAAVGITLLA
jgi:hypothetical protein